MDAEVVMAILGERVRESRELAGLSKTQLAELSGYSRGAITSIEDGSRGTLPMQTILDIAQALKKDWTEWFDFKKEGG